MANVTARDCSPFDKDDNNLKTLSENFLKANPKALENDEMVVSLRTCAYEDKIQTRWWAGRYIGLAKIGNCKISIRPRFGEKFLLKVLEDVYGYRFCSNDSSLKSDFSDDWFKSLLNILRRKQWIEKCTIANRYGLPRKVVKMRHQGTTIRGAIDVQRTILPWIKKNEVVSNTFEKVFDDSICKIVYEAYRIISRDIAKKKKGSKIENTNAEIPQAVTDTINALNNEYKGTAFNVTESDYRRINYKSVYASWKPLVDLSWSIIGNRNLNMLESENNSECIFIDMAEIWEAFLRKKLAEGLKNDNWKVWSIEECKLPVYEKSFFSRHIIPDIVLQRYANGKEQFLIFDAKYKRMTGTNNDVDRSDFLQIHTYIHYFQHAYSQSEVLLGGLLYPISANEEKIVNEKNHLFGKSDGEFNTKFIIDGVVCSEHNKEFIPEDMDYSVEAMINRISKHIEEY